MSKWPMVPLREVLDLQRRWIKVDPFATYEEIGVRCFGKGIFHKAPVDGMTLGNKRVLSIEPDDLVFNNVFAWEGAVAVAGPDEKGKIGSHRFVTYKVNPQLATPQFLWLYFTTDDGLELLMEASPGSAGRNKTLGLERFISQSIPLPPLSEQQKIVEWIDDVAIRVKEAQLLHQTATQELEALKASWAHATFASTEAARWPTRALGEVSDIRSGVTLGRTITGDTIQLPYLRVANVQDGYLDLSEVKNVAIRPEEHEKWRLHRGDLLLTEGGDWDKLGRGTVWEDEIEDCIHQNHVFRVRVTLPSLNPRFLWLQTSSPYGKSYFQSASKQTTNLASINQKQLKAFPVMLPPTEVQESLLSYANDLNERYLMVSGQHAELGKEADALIPSVLNEVFNGARS